MFECFTEKAIRAITLAQKEARRLRQTYVGTELILLGIIAEGTGIAAKILKSLGANFKEVRIEVEKFEANGTRFENVEIPFTPQSKRVLELALKESRQLGHHYVSTEHLLLGLCTDEQSVAAQILTNLEIDLVDIRVQVMQMLSESTVIPSGNGLKERRIKTLPKKSILEEVGTNLTQLASEGNLDPVVGRQKEVQRMVQILSRRTKNNPILIGEPGVGKTALAEGLAQRVINHDVPETLERKHIYSLTIGSLLAGTKYRGEFEQRLKAIVEEVRSSGDVILVIDEIHTLVSAGAAEGGLNAANLLKPCLARGELQCIGATTLADYRQYIERDPALKRRFQPVMVDESTVEETIQILQGVRSCYEQHHQLEISDLALEAAAKLSDRYICERFLPDKAIDLIDEAGSRVRISYSKAASSNKVLNKELRRILKEKKDATHKQNYSLAGELLIREVEIQKEIQGASQAGCSISTNAIVPIVNEEDIAHIVASWTGVPLHKLTESESENLLKIEDILHQRIIGQEEAVKAVSRAIRRVHTGLKNPNRPIASFIFSGPTGVGKTELAKVLASSYFGSESAMIRLDMSEYMESHTVAKMIGSPPGYIGFNEGGQLTESVRRKPYTVVLFDEIEKAHPDVFNLLLQVLDDGRLTDAKGRTIDFKNTLLIMTSNIGSRVIQKGGSELGFELSSNQAAAQNSRINSIVNEELKQFFRPEFLNRLDEIIVFQQLKKTEVKQIADILLREVFARLAEQEINLEVTDLFRDRLVCTGYDPEMGARPLRRAITQLLEDCLAEEILTCRAKAGDEIVFDVDEIGQTKVLIKHTIKSD